jgi:PilX N-terminal
MTGLARSRRMGQQGAATLVVVMVLFFIMAMMAAFMNRNLVFEQRIASNYFRSGLALETAEAGAEWSLSALNGIAIDAACRNDPSPGSSFRQRYLTLAPDRSMTITSPAIAACVASAEDGWVCQCPTSGGLTTPVLTASPALQPMFAVQFIRSPRPGVIRLQVSACTDLVSRCVSTGSASRSGLAKSVIEFDAALVSALKVPPAAPLIVRGTVDLGSTGLGLHNSDPNVSGLLLQAGGSYNGSLERLTSTPGTPGRDALISDDPTLTQGTSEQMFALYFGMTPSSYLQQPAMREVICESDCSLALLNAYASGARLLWTRAATRIASNITLGTAADPVVLVVNGDLTLDGPMLLNGIVHARGHASWSNPSGQPALLTGALISEGNMTASGSVDINYSSGVLGTISNQRGSFVRVPGSWTDVQ